MFDALVHLRNEVDAAADQILIQCAACAAEIVAPVSAHIVRMLQCGDGLFNVVDSAGECPILLDHFAVALGDRSSDAGNQFQLFGCHVNVSG